MLPSTSQTGRDWTRKSPPLLDDCEIGRKQLLFLFPFSFYGFTPFLCLVKSNWSGIESCANGLQVRWWMSEHPVCKWAPVSSLCLCYSVLNRFSWMLRPSGLNSIRHWIWCQSNVKKTRFERFQSGILSLGQVIEVTDLRESNRPRGQLHLHVDDWTRCQ